MDELLGVPCNTTSLENFFPNISSILGVNKVCKFRVVPASTVTIAFQAGDVYVDPNTYTVDLLFPDIDGDFELVLLTFKAALDSTILHFEQKNGNYTYLLRRYSLLSLGYRCARSEFTFDNVTFISTFNNDLRDGIFAYVNTQGANNAFDY